MKKFIMISLILVATLCWGYQLNQGYFGTFIPGGTPARYEIALCAQDDSGKIVKMAACTGYVYTAGATATDTVAFIAINSDSFWWYQRAYTYTDAGAYWIYCLGYGVDGSRDSIAGICKFSQHHLTNYVATMYAQVDSTLFYLQDTSATAGEIAVATKDTMVLNANTFKADTSSLARAALLVIVQDSLNKTLDSVEAILDSLQLWDDNFAYLDEAISGIDDNPWDAGTRSLTEKTGFALTNAQHAAIEDTIHAHAADYKATGFSTHNAAAVWSVGTRAITDKAGFALTTGERQAIADSVWAEATRALTDKANFTLTTGERQAIADSVWAEATRALTDKAGFALTTAERTAISDSVLTDSLKYRSDPSGQGLPLKAE